VTRHRRGGRPDRRSGPGAASRRLRLRCDGDRGSRTVGRFSGREGGLPFPSRRVLSGGPHPLVGHRRTTGERARPLPVSNGGEVLMERTRQVHRIESFELESGEVLHDIEQAYYLDGALNRERDNLVVIFHALTGSADAVGDWWSDLLGPGRAVDTERYAILCGNFVGSCYGSTGPSVPLRRPFPQVSPRDLARLVHAVVEDLGVRRVRLAAGGSLGGMVALEWAATFPQLTDRTVVFAAPASHTAAAIGWSHIQ